MIGTGLPTRSAGWDILLVRKADGLQIGIQAKLRCNVDVINQTLEEYGTWSADKAGPDCRAILVPYSEARGFDRIAHYIGFTIIGCRRQTRAGCLGTALHARPAHRSKALAR
jgi:hypothetical protein